MERNYYIHEAINSNWNYLELKRMIKEVKKKKAPNKKKNGKAKKAKSKK